VEVVGLLIIAFYVAVVVFGFAAIFVVPLLDYWCSIVEREERIVEREERIRERLREEAVSRLIDSAMERDKWKTR
jgi:hypothetical protein